MSACLCECAGPIECKHGRADHRKGGMEGGCICFSWTSHSEATEACNCYKSQQGSKSVRITSNQHHDMEDFYFSKDFHHSMCCWRSKVKKGILTCSARVLISLCSDTFSQIGRLLLSYLGLIHIQAYSQPYLESRSKISFQRGGCHYWCFNHQQVLLLLFWMFDNAANVEIKETEVFFSLRGNLRQRGESTRALSSNGKCDECFLNIWLKNIG